MKTVYVTKDSWSDNFAVYLSNKTGNSSSAIFTGTLSQCITITAAFVAVGYEAVDR